jgi:Zn-finger nucleic acid-binding protein
MEEMSCPKCQSTMRERTVGTVTVHQCSSCSGIFLERAELWNLTEAENDWYRDSGPTTQPLPRITADMTAPPPSAAPAARSYLELLFGS